MQQLELALGELEVASGAHGGAGARVEAQVADGGDLLVAGRAAAQQRLQARRDLLHRERLDDVVVGAGLEAAHAVVDLVAGREDADGHVLAAVAQAGEHLEAVEVGHVQVEQDDGRVHAADRLERRPAAGRGDDGEALQLEAGGHRAADARVVVHQQDDRPGRRRLTHAGRPRSRRRPSRGRRPRRCRGRPRR